MKRWPREWQDSTGIDFERNHESSWGEHIVLCAGHCQSRAAHEHHVGHGSHFINARTGFKTVAQLEAEHRDGSGEGRPGLAMNSFMLQPGEDKIVAEQLSWLFREHAA